MTTKQVPYYKCCPNADLEEQDTFREPMWCCTECGTWCTSDQVVNVEDQWAEEHTGTPDWPEGE